VDHLRREAVQEFERLQDALRDLHALLPPERRRRRASRLRLARQPVVQCAARAQLQHQAPVWAVGGEGVQ
jgi:hypothetical protein